MKNFEDSLRRLTAPDPSVAVFRRRLRRELSVAALQQSARRWRRACMASAGLAALLLIAVLAPAATPDASRDGLPDGTAQVDGARAGLAGDREMSVHNDRAFLEAYHAREGRPAHVRSLDQERLVAIREFTMSDGRKMMVYTELGEDRGQRSGTSLDDRLALLTSRSVSTF